MYEFIDKIEQNSISIDVKSRVLEDETRYLKFEFKNSDNETLFTYLVALTVEANCKVDYNGVENLDGNYYVELNAGESVDLNDVFTLNNPEKEGYTFIGWTGSNGEIPEKVVKIEKGTTGTVELFANWILAENVTVQAGENEELMVLYDDVSERYHFISKLGTIEHVVLDVVDSRYKYKNSPLSWSESKTVTK